MWAVKCQGECVGKTILHPVGASLRGCARALVPWVPGYEDGSDWHRTGLCKSTGCSNAVPQSQGDLWGASSLLWITAHIRSALMGC